MEFNKKVYMAATAYTLITGLAFLFVKIALTSADPFDLLAYRFTVAFIAILVAYAFKKVKIDYSIERIKKIIPLALIYPLSFFTFQTFGLQYTSSAEAGILMASSPVFTLLLATYFIKEKTTFYQKLSILLSVAGVIYITVNKSTGLNFNSILGVILILLTALSIAGYNVMARIYTRDFTSIELSSIMIFISFIGYNLISIIKHLIKGTLSSFFAPLTSISFIISILYLGVLSSLVTSLTTNYILSKIEASKMSVFANLATVITIIAGAVFLKENIYYYHIIGSILIVGGVLGTNFLDKLPKSEP
ncbi:MAG TPA: DMT family transporter [Tissierellia bacterium]|nr:DMT family transporter [Tissierellia bacterium]